MRRRASIGFFILSIYFAFVAGASHLPRNNPHMRRRSYARLSSSGGQRNGDIDFSFNLYTKKNLWQPQLLNVDAIDSVRNGSFANSDSTVFITHGWANNSTVISFHTAVLRYAYLNGAEPVNVIEVRWSWRGVSTAYRRSLKVAQTVGIQVARMIDFLKNKFQLNLNTTTLVGHSVGAHIMGVAGRKVSTGRVNQIFALDPARAHFRKPESELRLSRKSARNVQVIHTNGNQRGLLDPLGHADFYPNGGSRQPGCAEIDPSRKGLCSHYASSWLFAESLNNPTGFRALRCRPGEDALKGQCGGKVVLMGGRSNHIDATGTYYLETADQLPYALVLRRDKNKIYRFIKKNSKKPNIAGTLDLAIKNLI